MNKSKIKSLIFYGILLLSIPFSAMAIEVFIDGLRYSVDENQEEDMVGGRTSSFWKTYNNKYQTITDKAVNITGDLEFQDEIKPDGATCSAGQILKKTGADNWDCADESGGGGATDYLGQIGDVSTSSPLTYGEVIIYNTATPGWESVATSTLGLGGSAGTVSSVAMSVPTGLTITGSPITTSGTLALTYTGGYQMLTDVASTTWDNKWDALTDITLAHQSIFVGDGSNNPVATNTITILDNGNVGIGTTTPAYTLDVYGNIRADGDIRTTGTFYGDTWSSITGNSMAVQPTGDTDDFFSFKTPADRPTIKREGGKYIYIESTNIYDAGIAIRDGTDYSGTFAFEKDTDRMALSAKNSPLVVKLNSDYDDYFLLQTTSNTPEITVASSSALKINAGGTNDLLLNHAGGNVGIGTISPSQKLEVAGNIRLPATGFIELYGGGLFGDLASTGQGAYRGYYSGDKDFAVLTYNGAYFNRLTIKAATGNIGIGTTSPLSKFSMNSGTNGFRIDSSGIVQQGSWQGTALTDAYVSNTLTVDGYMQDSDINTFSELQSWVSDEVLLKAGTLTDTKYCIYDSASGDIICNSEGGAGGTEWTDDGLFLYPAETSDVVVIGGNATTTTGNILEVQGNMTLSAGNYYKYNNVNMMYASTTLRNYFFGNSGNLTMTGNYNTGFGYINLFNNTTGKQNTALGNQSLHNNRAGNYNTAVGYQALLENWNDSYNTALGLRALYKTASASSTGIGYHAGYNNTTGYQNTFVGIRTGGTITTGYQNTFLGAEADASANNLYNATAIGYNASVEANNSLILGNSVNVGIGSSSPFYKFSMNSGANGFGIDSSGIVKLGAWNGTAIDISDYTNLATSTGISLTGDALGLTLGEIDHDGLLNFEANEHLDWTADLGATNIHAGNYTDTNTTYLGGTNLTLTDTTFAVDDAFIVNNANDIMTGILTVDGLTLGANENITLGAQTLDHNAVDFVFSDSVVITGKATTTDDLVVGEDGVARPGCIGIRDNDSGGWSYFSALNGVLIESSVDCGGNATSTLLIGR